MKERISDFVEYIDIFTSPPGLLFEGKKQISSKTS